MSRNVKDWVRTIMPKLSDGDRGLFERYLCGTDTFADAAIALIERFVNDVDETEEDRTALKERLERILNRVNSGEDAEAVVREEIQPS